MATEVAVKDIVFIVEVGNEYVEPSVMVIVTHRDAHAPLLSAVSVDRHACFKSNLAKRPVPVVVVKIIRRRVVGDENIYSAVSIKITGDNIQPVVTDRIVDASLFRHVGKCSVAVIVVERVTCPRQAPGTTLHRNTLELARRAFAECG